MNAPVASTALRCILIWVWLSGVSAAESRTPISCVWPVVVPSVRMVNVTLAEAIAILQKEAAKDSRDKQRINVVTYTARLTSGETERRFTFEAEKVSAEEAVYAICRSTGTGYKIEPYAIVISSRSHLPLPRAPSERVRKLPDGAPPRRFLLFKLRPK